MNVDSETVCLRLLIKGLIVPIRLCILSIAYFICDSLNCTNLEMPSFQFLVKSTYSLSQKDV